jgi:hypothetical protein
MLGMLRSPDPAAHASALRGLRETVAQRPTAVAPFLLPRLVAAPLTAAAARALAAVAPACGPPLYPLLDALLPPLLEATYLEAELLPEGADPADANPEVRARNRDGRPNLGFRNNEGMWGVGFKRQK